MAVDFDGAASWVDTDVALDATQGFVSLWVNSDALPAATDRDIIATFHEDGAAEPFGTHDKNIFVNSGGTVKVMVFDGGDQERAASAGVIGIGAWHHILCWWSATELRVVLDGVGGTIEPTDGASFDFTNPAIRLAGTTGGLGDGEAGRTRFDGKMAEFGAWNRLPTDWEIQALAKGWSPKFFPNGRISYLALDRDLIDQNNPGEVTSASATFADHPPIFYPVPPLFGHRATAAAGPTLVAVSESVPVGMSESSRADVLIRVAETLGLSLTELASLRAALAASESVVITLNEQVALLFALDGDTTAVTLTEQASVVTRVAASDTVGVTVSEAVSLLARLAAGEPLSVVVAEAAAFADITATVVAVAETLGIGIAEAASLVILAADVSVSATESVAITLLETAFVNAFLGVTDPVTVVTAEDARIAAAAALADTVSIVLTELALAVSTTAAASLHAAQPTSLLWLGPIRTLEAL